MLLQWKLKNADQALAYLVHGMTQSVFLSLLFIHVFEWTHLNFEPSDLQRDISTSQFEFRAILPTHLSPHTKRQMVGFHAARPEWEFQIFLCKRDHFLLCFSYFWVGPFFRFFLTALTLQNATYAVRVTSSFQKDLTHFLTDTVRKA